MAAITGFDLCGKLCDLLGIPRDDVEGIDISVHCGEIVRVTVTKVCSNSDADGIIRTFTGYELHPHGEKASERRTMNEIRASEGLPPLADGAVHSSVADIREQIAQATRIGTVDDSLRVLSGEDFHKWLQQNPAPPADFRVLDSLGEKHLEHLDAQMTDECTCDSLLGLRNCPACRRKREEG